MPSTPPTVAPGPVPGPEQRDRADSPSLDGSSDLPQFAEISHPNFRWGSVDGTTFINLIDKAYDEIVHWRRNLFEIPRGNAGSSMVREVSRLLEAYSNASAMESVALKAAMVFPALMLQRPHPKNKAKLHVVRLEDRLRLWIEGEIDILLHEGRTIQQRLQGVDRSNQSDGRMARSFEKLVSVGNVKAALRLVTEQDRSGGLSLDSTQADGRTVRDHLLDKHPPDKPVNSAAVSNRPPADEPHHVLFDEIDGPLI